MNRELELLIFGGVCALMGFMLGFRIGQDHGFWKCYKLFTKKDKFDLPGGKEE